MKFELNSLPILSKESIAEDIIRVDKILNKNKLTKKDYLQHGKVGSGNTINKYFGSWHKALSFAGLVHKSNNRIPTQKLREQSGKFLSDEEVINELKNVATKLNINSLTVEQLNANSQIISNSTVSSRFGWKKGLELAGLNIVPHGRKYNDKECFENLLNVWTQLGKQPKGHDMNNSDISSVGLKAYTRRWGTWIKALTAFIEEANKENDTPKNQPLQNKTNTIKHRVKSKKINEEDRRDIRLGLRFKILNRDKFKCVLCGNSPATDLKCKLHVDHITPFSKGGKTIKDNLRSLCDDCNLGRGNRYNK